MHKRVMPWLVLIAGLSMGAEFRTPNFIVIAANPQVAQQIGQWAEHYRKEKATLWLGREMPAWPQPCPLRVTVSMDGPSGATEFTFGSYGVTSQKMQIQGPLDRLIHSVLPHEVTHTVFAHHFKSAVPRWADEGGSVFSEDDAERERHDKVVRSILNQRQQIPMRTLFGLKEYPPQVMCLYAQGFSICDFLVKRSNRQHFLNFVGAGMYYGWDSAVKSYYGHNNVEELEQAWLQHLRDTKKQPPAQFAANTTTSPIPGNAQAAAQPTLGFVETSSKTVRMTVPPVQPLDPPAVIRGAMPAPSQGAWQPNVRLESPVPLAPPLPRIPAYVPDDIRLGQPRP
ncbi:MAG: hypothetical protein FJ303_07175 [Planctomycetes bacterium]|nr:hypothetical protein [Planctomycetota bacterium]